MKITTKIHFRNIKGDITAAVIALPMVLTFGVASGAGASVGLWGKILVGFFAALFGGTPTLISEPTGTMTVVMTAIIANLTPANSESGLAMAFTVIMMAGILQIIFGALKLGRYVTLMPYLIQFQNILSNRTIALRQAYDHIELSNSPSQAIA